jgi:hypothetical protein
MNERQLPRYVLGRIFNEVWWNAGKLTRGS